MPTQYSHSADTLCLSIRALRLSGEEAPALSGSVLSPGTTRRNHVGWSCVQEKTGPREQECLTSLPSFLYITPQGLPRVSDTPGGTVLVTCTVAQNSLWLLLSKVGT